MTTTPKLLTTAQAAELVSGLSAWRIKELCKADVLPHIKAGRKILINPEIIVAFVENPTEFYEKAKQAEKKRR
jgi:hypothetical protein